MPTVVCGDPDCESPHCHPEPTNRPTIRVPTAARCPECGRVFDLTDTDDAEEWFYGHDCEG